MQFRSAASIGPQLISRGHRSINRRGDPVVGSTRLKRHRALDIGETAYARWWIVLVCGSLGCAQARQCQPGTDGNNERSRRICHRITPVAIALQFYNFGSNHEVPAAKTGLVMLNEYSLLRLLWPRSAKQGDRVFQIESARRDYGHPTSRYLPLSLRLQHRCPPRGGR